MKTPHAILIGLSLIAAAIFFKDTAVKPAYASSGHLGFSCTGENNRTTYFRLLGRDVFSMKVERDGPRWIRVN